MNHICYRHTYIIINNTLNMNNTTVQPTSSNSTTFFKNGMNELEEILKDLSN